MIRFKGSLWFSSKKVGLSFEKRSEDRHKYIIFTVVLQMKFKLVLFYSEFFLPNYRHTNFLFFLAYTPVMIL